MIEMPAAGKKDFHSREGERDGASTEENLW